MSYKEQSTKGKWYTELMQRFQGLTGRLGLSEHEADQVKEFILSIAREQFMAGNRSGIAWMHKKAGTSRVQ